MKDKKIKDVIKVVGVTLKDFGDRSISQRVAQNRISAALRKMIEEYKEDMISSSTKFERLYDNIDIMSINNARDPDFYKQLFLKWISELSGYTENEISNNTISKRGSQYLRFVRKFWCMTVIDTCHIKVIEFPIVFPGYHRSMYYDVLNKYNDILYVPKFYPVHIKLITDFNERWKSYNREE